MWKFGLDNDWNDPLMQLKIVCWNDFALNVIS